MRAQFIAAAPRFALALAVLSSACSSERHRVDAESEIASALAMPGAIQFRSDGGPLDAHPPSSDTLDLATALRNAVTSSPEIQASLARVRVAQAEADFAKLLPNPVLSIVLRFPESGGKTQIEAGLGSDLLAVLERPRRASAAGHRLEAEAARALSTALDVVAEVEERFSEVQALEELVPVLDRRLELLGRLREVAQARLDLGEGTRHDVAALDSELAESSVETAQRRQDLGVARLALARAIGAPSGAAAWKLEPWVSPAPISENEQAWTETALRGRPEVLAIEWELRARELDERLARRRALDGATAGLEAERDGDWSAGPSVATPLPLFDTGRARAERARASTSEERHRLTQTQRRVVEEVRSSLAILIGAQANHERVVRDLVPLQERRRAETEEAYRLGLVDVTALLFADQALQQAHARRVGLAREVSLAQNRLQRSVGGASLFRATATNDKERSQP